MLFLNAWLSVPWKQYYWPNAGDSVISPWSAEYDSLYMSLNKRNLFLRLSPLKTQPLAPLSQDDHFVTVPFGVFTNWLVSARFIICSRITFDLSCCHEVRNVATSHGMVVGSFKIWWTGKLRWWSGWVMNSSPEHESIAFSMMKSPTWYGCNAYPQNICTCSVWIGKSGWWGTLRLKSQLLSFNG